MQPSAAHTTALTFSCCPRAVGSGARALSTEDQGGEACACSAAAAHLGHWGQRTIPASLCVRQKSGAPPLKL